MTLDKIYISMRIIMFPPFVPALTLLKLSLEVLCFVLTIDCTGSLASYKLCSAFLSGSKPLVFFPQPLSLRMFLISSIFVSSLH